MKILYLLRHARAEAKEQRLADYDRPLDERGINEAQFVAEYIHGKNMAFDYVMCSAALRTQETLEPLRQVLTTKAIEISEQFYNSTEDQILQHIRHVENDKNKILYIGHNPGIAFAALKLSKDFSSILKEGVTPATLIGFQLPIHTWSELDWGLGEIIDVFQPNLPLTKPL